MSQNNGKTGEMGIIGKQHQITNRGESPFVKSDSTQILVAGEKEPDSSSSSKIYSGNVTALPSADQREKLRILEALLFAASEPLDEKTLADNFDSEEDMSTLLEELQSYYSGRGVNLVRVAGKWSFRTAEDLSFLLEKYQVQQRKLSRAALETLAIIAYHQPVTRAEIEDIRGVSTSRGTLDVLMESGWIRPRGRRRTPGRPVTYGTSDAFLVHFGFNEIKDLPGLKDLKEAGLLEGTLPNDFIIPTPDDSPELNEDEDPLSDIDDSPSPHNFPGELEEINDKQFKTDSNQLSDIGKFGT